MLRARPRPVESRPDPSVSAPPPTAGGRHLAPRPVYPDAPRRSPTARVLRVPASLPPSWPPRARGGANPFGLGFAEFRVHHRALARPPLRRLFGNHFEKERVDVIGSGQQQVLLRAALAAALNKLVAVLKVVMALHGR